jgi:hypothetical protein
VVLVYSRYSFFWPLIQQTVEATIEGLEKAWAFFGGLPVRLIMDNFPAARARPSVPAHPKHPCVSVTATKIGNENLARVFSS